MAESASDAATGHRNRQNALSDIQFASIIDPDLTPSEDETPDEKTLQLEDAQSAIGVSIGQQQTRLTSPKTPAAEKAAALDDVEGGGLFEGWQQASDGTIDQRPQEPSPVGDQSDGSELRSPVKFTIPSRNDSPVRLPSPWRASPKKFQQEDDHRAALRDTFAAGYRRRALSGGSATEALRKYIPFNLPSMPKTSSLLNFSLPSFSVSSFDSARGRPSGNAALRKRATSPIPQNDRALVSKDELSAPVPRQGSLSEKRQPATDPSSIATPDVPRPSLQRRQTPKLRRSNSEGSLLLYRSRSFASSLGDDSRFEHVQEQVNSRFKAIKDSWQDANFKLPSMPTLPNFNFGSREDLFRPRNGSTTPRGFDNTRPSPMVTSFSVKSIPTKIPRAKESSTNIAGMSATTHPYFARALQELTGDLVILGGYRGSILRSAEPPNRQLWVPIKVGLNLRKVDLELGLNPEDEETEEDRIIPAGMLTNIGPVDIAKRLFKRLRASENAKNGSLRVHNYGYDWRLSPHILSRRLIEYLKTLPCNQPGVPPEKRGAVMIAHSLGGLITRHAVNQNPELFAGVIYAGVPQTCVNILGPLRNGDDVLLSSRVLTAQVNFTIRTSYALLPLDGKCFFNKYTKEEYPVDFFNVKTWIEHSLSPCVAAPLPAPTQMPNSSLTGITSATPTATCTPSPNTSSFVLGNSGSITQAAQTAAFHLAESSAQTTGMTVQLSSNTHTHKPPNPNSNPQDSGPPFPSLPPPSTTITIPHDKALTYLTRTLAEIKTFKLALAHHPPHTQSNSYPPIALIYGKSTPTVYGAKVESRDAIKRADAYDELAFASGDGVVLARAAMAPEGYSVERGGVVSSDRGHVTLLGDLEAVGRCLITVLEARRSGVGLGRGRVKGKPSLSYPAKSIIFLTSSRSPYPGIFRNQFSNFSKSDHHPPRPLALLGPPPPPLQYSLAGGASPRLHSPEGSPLPRPPPPLYPNPPRPPNPFSLPPAPLPPPKPPRGSGPLPISLDSVAGAG
ncbi:uncharacterized protein BDR25DRAFT_334717 [Lindgomyces ingoldianus]|uniref:Uncharacterized protein n=1 Tax=Lindgomyces ingoldianus TaxID=673940 RepID=A0ACB6QS96_9PLEO|nr:uncharacterized protein BDR25DRAFT_334717 [Lindgomyces ingoldianus]KAF2469755.1 hypothetical protein BDR25DRAFT_334717 [Lindgomyces ingoldianus]